MLALIAGHSRTAIRQPRPWTVTGPSRSSPSGNQRVHQLQVGRRDRPAGPSCRSAGAPGTRTAGFPTRVASCRREEACLVPVVEDGEHHPTAEAVGGVADRQLGDAEIDGDRRPVRKGVVEVQAVDARQKAGDADARPSAPARSRR